MLMKLLIIRLAPLGLLSFAKDKNQMKLGIYLYLLGFLLMFAAASIILIERLQGKALLYLPILVMPQYVFYIFSIWILFRCVRQSWSARVWKRIYILSIFCTMIGVLAEKYCNPIILRFFFNFFK